jgi:hypothetical protein
MMNILPRNPVDHKAKSPCDKNIRYPVCVPGHDSPNGTTFLTIVVYDKQKTALVDDPSDMIKWPSDLSGQETIYSCDQVTWIICSGGFRIKPNTGNIITSNKWETLTSNAIPYEPRTSKSTKHIQ